MVDKVKKPSGLGQTPANETMRIRLLAREAVFDINAYAIQFMACTTCHVEPGAGCVVVAGDGKGDDMQGLVWVHNSRARAWAEFYVMSQ